MAEQKKHIDDIVRKELNDYKEAPREALWNKIEANLDNIEHGGKTTRPGGLQNKLLWYGLGALLVCTIGFVAYNKLNTADNKQNNVTVNNTVVTEPKAEPKTAGTIDNSVNANKTETDLNDKTNIQTSSVKVNENNSANNKDAFNTNTVASNKVVNNTSEEQKAKDSKPVKTISGDTLMIANKNSDQFNVKPVLQPNIATTTVPATEKSKTEIPVEQIANKNSKQFKTPITKPTVTATKIPATEKDKTEIPIEQIANKNSNEFNVAPVVKPNIVAANIPNSVIEKTSENKTDLQKTEDAKKKIIIPADTQKLATHNNTLLKVPAIAKTNTIPTVLNQPVLQNSTEQKQDKKESEILPNSSANNIATKKTDETSASTDLAANSNGPGGGGVNEKIHSQINLSMSGGVKAGYELGFGTYSGNKGTISGYLQIAPSEKISIVIQPGVTFTTLNRAIDYGTKQYYNNAINKHDSNLISAVPKSIYFYYQIYDSQFVARKSTKGILVGFEIPVFFKYQVSKNISLSAGVNIDISKLISISESTPASYHVITKVDTFPDLHTPAEFAAFYNNYSYSHTIPAYTPLLQPTGDPVRIGYIFGIGYKMNNKTEFELMMTQTLSNQGYIPDQNIKSLYTQPYFRFSIGYRIFDPADKKKTMNK